MTDIRVHVIEDQLMFRDGLVHKLRSAVGIGVVGDSPSVEEAIKSTATPDVVLLDLQLGEGQLMREEAIRALFRRWADSKILVVTDSTRKSDFLGTRAEGAHGYMTKASSVSDLVDAIEIVATGRPYITPLMAGYLLKEDGPSITPRQREILRLIAQGMKLPAIGKRLFISTKTVEHHVENIGIRTGQRGTAALTLLAVRENLTDIQIKD